MLVQVHKELETKRAPQVRERDVRADGSQLHFGVERKELPLVDETIE